MVDGPGTESLPKKSGWRKGCSIIAVILGLAAVATIALLLGGYAVASLSSKPPGRSEIVKQMEELVAVVGDFYSGDEEGGASGSQPIPQPTATHTPTPRPPSPTPRPPSPTSTRTPTPTPATEPGSVSSDEAPDVATEPEPKPDPEPSEGFVEFEMIVIGLMFKSREYYSTGTVAAGINDPDPYAFAKSSMPSMDIKLRTMPTDRFPGSTSAAALPTLFQERLVDKITGSGEWAVVTDPFDVDVNGLPATRMSVEFRRTDEKTFCYHMTAIRGETRSGFVYGSYGVPCPDAPGRADEITAIADSVQLSEPGSVCSVGLKPGSDPAEYGVGCDYLPAGWVGVDALKESGYTDIVLGPVTWDECAEFMREHDQPRW